MNPLKLKTNLSMNIWPGILSVCLTFIVFMPSLLNGFVNWDDPGYVYANQGIQTMDLKFLRWIFTSEANATWHPLTMLSLAIDYKIWGLNPFGYHLTNLLLHVINTLLVYILTNKLLSFENPINPQKTAVSLATSILFGIHPLHVESVAWISERKDVLSAFFSLLTILSYLLYVTAETTRKTASYVMTVILFVLSLMSKPMAVTLPLVLLIIDFYPLRRFVGKKVWVEKIPFFALSLIVSLLTIYVQKAGGALRTLETYPLASRLFVGLESYMLYIIKMFFPVNLAPFYPYPQKTDVFMLYIAVFVLAFICLYMAKNKNNKGYLSVWLYYTVTLLPVIGIIKVGAFAAADRYTYISMIGPFILISVKLVSMLSEKMDKPSKAVVVAAFIFLFCLMVAKTIRQISIWDNSITLWSHELKYYPNNVIALNNRGEAHSDLNRFAKALSDFNRAIEVAPNNIRAHNNLGNLLNNAGNYQEAIKSLSKAIELDPENGQIYYNRGSVYSNMGDYRRAIVDYSKAIELNPKQEKAFNNRANAYAGLGDYLQAVLDLEEAVKINPRYGMAYYNLGTIYLKIDDYQRSRRCYEKAASLGVKKAEEKL